MHPSTSRPYTPAFVLTFHPRFRKEAVMELHAVDPLAQVDQPDPGHALVRTTSGLLEALSNSPPVFIEHVAPVTTTLRVDGDVGDPAAIASAAVAELAWRPHASLAVECRRSGGAVSGRHAEAAYTCRDIEIRVGTSLAAAGASIDLTAPDAVAHIFLEDVWAHMGIAEVGRTLRAIADPFARGRAVVVSRAERKLEEALMVFRIPLFAGMRVLDLGAAPGGWSWLLAERGAVVTAVDPAALDARVAGHPAITHVGARAEHFLPRHNGTFDLVVNDMALDPDDSARVMVAAATVVPDGAPAVMTVKLPTRNVKRWLHAAHEVLDGVWDVETARHLAANRQEVTWLLRRLPR